MYKKSRAFVCVIITTTKTDNVNRFSMGAMSICIRNIGRKEKNIKLYFAVCLAFLIEVAG